MLDRHRMIVMNVNTSWRVQTISSVFAAFCVFGRGSRERVHTSAPFSVVRGMEATRADDHRFTRQIVHGSQGVIFIAIWCTICHTFSIIHEDCGKS